jgi:hypothetical protein
MAPNVIGALRRFLPEAVARMPFLDTPRRRAVWAMTHCRTAEMGGHVHACPDCGKQSFAFHSCNHRSCPQCGGMDTAKWVHRELGKRVGAPYFMVTFTVPAELRGLFQGKQAKQAYDLFFQAASSALKDVLANPRWLGAKTSGFTMILHTWNQRMGFHPHLHAIVPGAGLDGGGTVVSVKNANFLVPQKALRQVFRARFRDLLAATGLPQIEDPAVWRRSWGVHLQPFGSGANAIRYLGRYVCHPVIGNARIQRVEPGHVTYQWTDRAHGNLQRTDRIPGADFVHRYLRHVLPTGMRSIRYYGFCHPTAKRTRERIAMYTGATVDLGAPAPAPEAPPHTCSRCGTPTQRMLVLTPKWKTARAPP